MHPYTWLNCILRIIAINLDKENVEINIFDVSETSFVPEASSANGKLVLSQFFKQGGIPQWFFVKWLRDPWASFG